MKHVLKNDEVYEVMNRAGRSPQLISQTDIRTVKETKNTKRNYEEKQCTLFKIWLIYSGDLATRLTFHINNPEI